MEQIRKKRTIAKVNLSKARSKLKEIISDFNSDKTFSKIKIEFELTNFQDKLTILNEVQEQYELLIEESELEEEIANALEFQEDKLEDLIKVKEILVSINDSVAENRNVSKASNNVNARLPKLELPKFNGDVTKWQTFWDKFNAIVHQNSDISDINKFTYLQSLLKEEALSCISGLSLTTENYASAREILQKRFGSKERIIAGHVQTLLGMSTHKTAHTSEELWHLYDRVQINVRSLENLGIKGETFGVILTPIVLHLLPDSIRYEYSKVSDGHEQDLEFLLKFLHDEITRRERVRSFRQQPEDRRMKQPQTDRATASMLTAPISKAKDCAFCDSSGHYSIKCPQIKQMDIQQRQSKVRELKLCFMCLGRGHLMKNCIKNFTCKWCNKKHNVIFCPTKFDNENKHLAQGEQRQLSQKSKGDTYSTFNGVTTVDKDLSSQYVNTGYRSTLLQVAHTVINGKITTVMLDTGSDRSYVTQSAAKCMSLESNASDTISLATFGGNGVRRSTTEVYQLSIGNKTINLLGIKTICKPLYRKPVPVEHLAPFQPYETGENLNKGIVHEIDILIGMDHYYDVICPEIVCISNGLVCQKSVFGYIISGSYNNSTNSEPLKSTTLFCQDCEPMENTMKMAWSLDSIGITEASFDSSDDQCMLKLRESLTFKERYYVNVPWKSEEHKHLLKNNVNSAEKRLMSLTKRLDSNPKLKKDYALVFEEFENLNIIEEVPVEEIDTPNTTFYLPHHPVVREHSCSTKVRPVFDASAKDVNGLSLNECLEAGPNLIPDLVKVLIRFRRHKWALTGDIKQAFLQIGLKSESKDVHRFLLLDKAGELRHMRFNRVTFGNKSSPFILNATIKAHLETQQNSLAVNELATNLYVDDWLTGSDTEEGLMELKQSAQHIMQEGGFVMTKWLSNSQLIKNDESKSLVEHEGKDTQKVLGLCWSTENDAFHFQQEPNKVSRMDFTKRKLLSIIAKLFDPLGLMTPFTITLKILFQNVWRLGVEWDEKLPDEMQDEIEGWLSDLKQISQLKIPRRLSVSPWSGKKIKRELIVFCDASTLAYGCCVYLLCAGPNGKESTLIASKVRVSPIQKITLPRLELLSAVLGARLLKFVREALGLSEETEYQCYSDSKITLGWIRSNPSKWKQFVMNRVSEIQTLTSPQSWRYCNTKQNPADLLTRGVKAKVLIDSDLWQKGPHWLIDDSGKEKSEVKLDQADAAEEMMEITMAAPEVSRSTLIDYENYSSFEKILGIMTCVLKFIKKLKGKPHEPNKDQANNDNDENSDLELRNIAKCKVLQDLQKYHYQTELINLNKKGVVSKNSAIWTLSPFLDHKGLIRVKGRLNEAIDMTYDETHPVILPKCHITELMVRDHHSLMKHCGVKTLVNSIRSQYWIVKVRSLAKRVVKKCVACIRHNARCLDQTVGGLPKERLTRSPPFSFTGIDYAGPVYVKNHPGKFYVLLFTCGTTRAVHLEVTDNLNVEEFLMAFKRFVSRRMLPSIIYSDNAKTFLAVKSLIQKEFRHACLEWRCISPRAAWQGGMYERLIRSVKDLLKKTIGTQKLSKNQLVTLLTEVEACINSRPLVYETENDIALTPNHFLIGKSTPFSSQELSNLAEVIDLDVVSRKNHEQNLSDSLWAEWQNSYLKMLQPLPRKRENVSVKVGSVVLIKKEKAKRMAWPMGIVQKIFTSKDNCIRNLQIKTADGSIVRPIQNLVLLELESQQMMYEPNQSTSTGKKNENATIVRSKANDTESKNKSSLDLVDDQRDNDSGSISHSKSTELKQSSKYRSKIGRTIKTPKKFDL